MRAKTLEESPKQNAIYEEKGNSSFSCLQINKPICNSLWYYWYHKWYPKTNIDKNIDIYLVLKKLNISFAPIILKNKIDVLLKLVILIIQKLIF